MKINKNVFIELCILILVGMNLLGSKIYSMRYLKYATIVLIIGIISLIFLGDKKIIIKNKNKNINNIIYSWIYISFIFLIISTILQLINRKFTVRTLEEVAFILMPTILVLFIVNLDNNLEENVEKYINTIFYMYIISFFVKFYNLLNIQNIMAISMGNSYSPFESEYSDIFLFLFLWYLLKNKKIYSIICFILCYLSMKRIHIILLICTFFIIKSKKKFYISRKSIGIIVLINVMLVLFMEYAMLSNNFNNFFESKFGESFDAFTSGRSKIIKIFDLQENAKLDGFGSTTEYLKPYKEKNIIDTDNLHADTLKIYYEMGIITLLLFSYLLYKGSLNNMYIFMLCVMYNSVIVGSHMMDNIMTNFVFLIICCGLNFIKERSIKEKLYNEN